MAAKTPRGRAAQRQRRLAAVPGVVPSSLAGSETSEVSRSDLARTGLVSLYNSESLSLLIRSQRHALASAAVFAPYMALLSSSSDDADNDDGGGEPEDSEGGGLRRRARARAGRRRPAARQPAAAAVMMMN